MSQISEVFQASPNNLDGQKGSFILVYEIHTNNSSFQINQKTTNENHSDILNVVVLVLPLRLHLTSADHKFIASAANFQTQMFGQLV